MAPRRALRWKLNWTLVPGYRCSIRGENFPGALVDREGLYGFDVMRFIEAADPEAAEASALDALRAESRLAAPEGYVPNELACVHFETIEECDAGDVPEVPVGFAWFPMKEE